MAAVDTAGVVMAAEADTLAAAAVAQRTWAAGVLTSPVDREEVAADLA
jgi:hypothetical protein